MIAHVRPFFRQRRAPRGQIMVLFALTFTLFMGACLLGVDLVLIRYQSENAQQAANAAALAGVIYLPDYVSNADAYAVDEANRNGYDNGVNGVSVTPLQVSGKPNELQVSISTPVHLIFGGLFGSALRSVTRSAIAEFYQTLETGSPDNVLGYAPFYTTVVTPTAPEGFYLENKGQFEYKESGDAYSPYFESYYGRTFLNGQEITGVSTSPPQCPPGITTSSSGAVTCTGSTSNVVTDTTTANLDNDSGGTAFNGYNYIVDDPITNTLVIKLFDPYSEEDYNSAAESWDGSHGTADAPSDSNNPTTLGISSTLTSPTSSNPNQCILGGTASGSPLSCPTSKMIDQGFGSGNPFGDHGTTLQFTLYGPALSPVDQNMPQVTTIATSTVSTQAKCTGESNNCVIASQFQAGDDPTACSTITCTASPYAYRFLNYAIIHGPGIFRVNVRSVQNANTTGASGANDSYGTLGNAYGIAVCDANTRNTGTGNLAYTGPFSETLGDANGNPITSNPFINSGATPGWNSNSCQNPNDPTVGNGGQCSDPADPSPSTALCIHVYGLGQMAIHNWLSAGKSVIPLGYIPPEYAGKTLLIRLYDVADTSSSAVMQPLTPAGDLTYENGMTNTGTLSPTVGYSSTLPYTYQGLDDGLDEGYKIDSAAIQAAANYSITVTSSGGAVYNGSWLNIQVPLTLPSSQQGGYTGMVQNFGGYWKMVYNIAGNADDATTWAIQIAGSPTHLVSQ